MKKNLIVLSLIALVFTGCKNDKKTTADSNKENDTIANNLFKKDKNGESIITGEFIYTDNASVINGNNFILGVVLDSMAKKLAKKVEPVKDDEFDMVPVTIKGKIIDNPPNYDWDQAVKITKIIYISKRNNGDSAIKINDKKSIIKVDNQNNKNS